MFEILALFAVVIVIVGAFKVGALLVHLLLLPFHIVGAFLGFILFLIALPFALLLLPLAVAGMALLAVGLAGVFLSLICGAFCAL